MIDPKQKPQGKPQKGAGAKDAKLQKRNKNVTSALPDRAKEAKLEADVNREMVEHSEASFKPWQRAIIDLQRQGWSFDRILKARDGLVRSPKLTAKIRKSIPSRPVLYRIRKEQPAWAEELDRAIRDFVNEAATEMGRLSKTYLRYRRKVKLNDGTELVPTVRDMIHSTHLQIRDTVDIAGRLIPGKWGDQVTSDQEVIVFDHTWEWNPAIATRADGTPIGQGPEAAAAEERWRKMREEQKEER